MDNSDSSDALIKKEIIYNGSKYVPLVDGTKVYCVFDTGKNGMFKIQILPELGEVSLPNQNML